MTTMVTTIWKGICAYLLSFYENLPAFFTRFLDLFDVCIQLRMIRDSLPDFVERKGLVSLIETFPFHKISTPGN